MDQLLSLSDSVRKTLQDSLEKEILLEFNLERMAIVPTPTPMGKIYVANEGSNDISVIDEAIHIVTATVPVMDFPEGVGVNPMASALSN